MASSKKLLPSDLPALVEAKLKNWVQPGRHLTLALSGGADSVVLLDILAQLRAGLHFHLSSLYINHQISPNAARWGHFCAELCARHDVPFETVTVDVGRRAGESLEALARAARYQVFSEQPADFVVLAQHLDDQAETLLLQLLRGAGAKGLSAMAELSTQDSGRGTGFLRPLLDVPRRTIVDYAVLHGLKWVEDESNADIAFDRNYLRHEVLPLLGKRFPGYRETFSRTSRNLAECALLLDDLARLDHAAAVADGRLRVEVLRELSGPRAKNLMRHYLAGAGAPTPSAGRLENMLQQLRGSRDDAQVRICLGDVLVRRYRGDVYIEKKTLTPQSNLGVSWVSQKEIDLPDSGGRLLFEHVAGQGLSLARLTAEPVTIRLRQGGEHLRPDCRRPNRSLKNLLQEGGVPSWQRQSLPLLFSGETLVFVPGIGAACEYQAKEGEPGLVVKFERSI
ncbi:MAG: tRNA lysidine(34) synthetase TilS [Gammaproteobacteria bacterium]|nr:tRNA lysidine(34) synthetase TilS [Gammaproteobacteria bacterium]